MSPESRTPHPSGVYGVVKRLADVVTSVLGLALLAPLLALIWVVIRVESLGPGIFRQRRIGRWGDEFMIVKFRTMATDAPDVATHELTSRASYVTRFGGILRRTSLDELPQLWNVLTGEMSVVGPRPALWSQYDLTERRHALGVDALRPGITGLAQVMGRDDLALDDKIAFDEQYLETVSLGTDVRILWRTTAAAISGRGAR